MAEGREVIAAAADIDCIESLDASEERSSYAAMRDKIPSDLPGLTR
jgi:hypothetical protein